MKKTFSILIALFVSLIVYETNANPKPIQAKKTVATYNEFTDNGQFKFTDDQKKVLLFDEVADGVQIDLYDDVNLGKKFSITWEEEEVDVYDEEGEPTGDTQMYKRITSLEEVE